MVKKLLIIAASLSTQLTDASAREVIDLTTLLPVSPTTSTAPDRTVETLDDGVLVTYSFRYVAVDSASYAPGTCIYSFDGFGIPFVPEMPALPSYADVVEVPIFGNSSLSIESIEYVTLDSEIAPVQEPVADGAAPKSVHPIKPYSGFYPENPVRVAEDLNHRGRKARMIAISPISYCHSTKVVNIATSISYKINFPSGNTNSTRSKARIADNNSIDDSNMLDEIALNPMTYSDDSNTKDVTSDYLIITTDKMKSAVSDFAAWKRMLGFRVHVSSRESWPSDSEVRDSINRYYNDYTETLKYLLIVGSHEDIPAMVLQGCPDPKYADKKYVSDFYYACVGSNYGFSPTPDLYYGRIPAKSNNDAVIAFCKIKDYEKICPHPEGSFSRALHCAYFQDENNDGCADMRFVLTSEEILNNSRLNHFDVHRVYTTNSSVKPLYYLSPSDFQMPLPDELLDDSFNWRVNSLNKNKEVNADIKAVLSKGIGYMLCCTHGSFNGWDDPHYTSSNVLQEYFGTKTSDSYNWIYPIVFSISCNTGAFDQEGNFAAISLTKELGGSTCVLAATNVCYSPKADLMGLKMFDSWSIRPLASNFLYPPTSKPTIRPHTQYYRIGELLQQGLFYVAQRFANDSYAQYHYEVFHCFGDPSMMIRTMEPAKFEKVETSYNPNTGIINVTTNDGPAYIAFHHKNTEKSVCYYGETVEFKISDILSANQWYIEEDICLLIYGPDRVPYSTNLRDIKFGPLQFLYSVCKFEDLIIDGNGNLKIEFSLTNRIHNAFILLTNAQTGEKVKTQHIDITAKEVTIDVSSLSSGIYVVALIADDNLVDSQKINL
ncbi:MAG: hypothetical protein K2M97_05345 [Muribaculaceae bacterium]|nr:hypothetical protein [Muribaculaceae bacterium]